MPANLDIRQTGTTDLDSKNLEYSQELHKIDGVEDKKNEWDFPNWPKKLGYFNTIPEYNRAVKQYGTWVLGKGFTARNPLDTVIFDHVSGWGEDSFLAVLWNMLIVKKINGDSFAEVMRGGKNNNIINIKPLDPGKMKIEVNGQGRIIMYHYRQVNGKYKAMEPKTIFHLCNDRIADQIHGCAASDSAEWVIETRQEVLADLRRIMHRSTVRILYVEEDDKTRRTNLKRDYAEGIKTGEVIILPGKAEDYQFQDLTVPPTEAYLGFIRYLENFFYQVVGVPPVISGGTEGQTEASSKVGVMVFEPNYIREITDLENDIWKQLGKKISFIKPESITSGLQQQEEKNNAQTGFQPNDTQVNIEGER